MTMTRSDVNHVGITVGDIDAAVTFYTEVFGLELLDGPMLCDRTTPGAERRADVFGPDWAGMRLAHLLAANGTGIELFQFLTPPGSAPEDNFRYWWFGPHHVAFTVESVHDSVAAIVHGGGRQRTAVHDVHDGALVCYCEDPWANVIEVVGTAYRSLSTATTK